MTEDHKNLILSNEHWNNYIKNKENYFSANFFCASLDHADLSKKNLVNRDLRNAQLQNSKLCETDLRSANLSGANLAYANLSGADLRNANLINSKLDEADLSGADLRNADLRGASFKKTILYTAKLHDAFFDVTKNPLPDIVSQDSRTGNFSFNPLKPASIFSCFISYSRKDQHFAHELDHLLKNEGIRCWLDENEIRPNENVGNLINLGIEVSKKVLFCVSKNSLNSEWVDREIEKAIGDERRSRSFKIIPLDIDGHLYENINNNRFRAVFDTRPVFDFRQRTLDSDDNSFIKLKNHLLEYN